MVLLFLEKPCTYNVYTCRSIYVFSCSFCDLIGQLPLYLHDNSESETRDHNHLDYLIKGHISLQTAGLLLSTLEIKVITHINYVPCLRTPTQKSKLSTVCDGLLESVLGSLKPLLLGHTPDSAPSEARTLSPANETSVGLLLELALITGVTVSMYINKIEICLIHISTLQPSAFIDCLLDRDRGMCTIPPPIMH